MVFFFFSSRRRHTRFSRDWSSDVCSSDLGERNGIAVRREHTEADGASKTEAALDRVIGRILVQEAQEACTRAEVGIGDSEVGAVEPAFAGIGGVVAGVAHPGGAELRDQSRLFEQRYLLGRNVQI